MAASASSPAKRKSKDRSSEKATSSSPRSHSSHKKTKLTSSTNNASANPPSKKDRQSQRKHADIVVEGKRLWNQLRCKGNTPEQTRSLLDELMPLITGKVPEIALQHDASRVVQAAIQFGNTLERQQIVRELCAADGGKSNSSSSNAIVELCKSQYAHFVVLKIIKYCSGTDGNHSDCMKQITSKLKGHMAKLAVHATASRVVQSLWEHLATPTHKEQWATLKLDFYGPQFALFAPDTLQKLKQNVSQEENKNTPSTTVVVPTLSAILKLYPDQKDATLDFVKRLVYKGMEKQLYGLGYFHTLLLEYLQCCASTLEIRGVAATAADHALHLLSGRAGTHVVALLASYGTAKDRKRLCKSLKGFARSGLLHRDAYLAILRLVQVTDDCVLIQKNILQELLVVPTNSGATTTLAEHSKTKEAKKQIDENVESPLLEFALSDNASKLLLMLLVDEGTEAWNKMLDPYERQVLFASPTVLEQGQEVPTSKKEPTVRRLELLPMMREPLVELCRRHANQLLRSNHGSAVLKRVYMDCGRSPQTAPQRSVVVQAILDACEASLQNDDSEDDKYKGSIFEDALGHRVIQNIIAADYPPNDDSVTKKVSKKNEADNDSFSVQFLKHFHSRLQTHVAHSNRGAFVVAGLCRVPGLRDRVVKALDKTQIRTRSQSKEGPTAGFAALMKEIR